MENLENIWEQIKKLNKDQVDQLTDRIKGHKFNPEIVPGKMYQVKYYADALSCNVWEYMTGAVLTDPNAEEMILGFENPKEGKIDANHCIRWEIWDGNKEDDKTLTTDDMVGDQYLIDRAVYLSSYGEPLIWIEERAMFLCGSNLKNFIRFDQVNPVFLIANPNDFNIDLS